MQSSVWIITWYFCFFINMIFFSSIAKAIKQDDSIEISVVGKLITPPTCEINQGRTLHVNFGENVIVQKIASGEYTQVLPLEVTCDSDNTDGWIMDISVSGRPASFDASGATLESDKKMDLGVRLTLNGQPLRINSWKSVDLNNLPEIRAELAMRPGAILDDGPFQVSGTMKVEYN